MRVLGQKANQDLDAMVLEPTQDTREIWECIVCSNLFGIPHPRKMNIGPGGWKKIN